MRDINVASVILKLRTSSKLLNIRKAGIVHVFPDLIVDKFTYID